MTKANTTTARATAKKQAPKAAPAKVEAKAPAPQAPRFTLGPWPVKAQGGNSIRAYCYGVAKALAKVNGDAGFTVRELAGAFAAQASGTDYRQPGGGWGTEAKPNGIAMQHANWFAHEKQGWLSPIA